MAFKLKGSSFLNKKDERITPKMMQQLDDQITKMRKLGKKGAVQVLLDKKSKLLDKYQQQ